MLLVDNKVMGCVLSGECLSFLDSGSMDEHREPGFCLHDLVMRCKFVPGGPLPARCIPAGYFEDVVNGIF